MPESRSKKASLGLLAVALVGTFAATSLFLSATRSSDESPQRTTSTLPTREPLEPEELLDAWERSLIGPYAQSGTITRTRGDELEVTQFRRAAREGRTLNQSGSTAFVTEDGQQAVCEIFDATDIRCGRAEAAPTLAEQRESLAAELTPRGPYLIFDDAEPGCFLLVYDGAVGLGSRFGQETRLCFDQSTGALVSRVQRTGSSVETLTTVTLHSDVEDGDLEPAFAE